MTRLPPALASWQESLADLGAEVARAVGPLLPRMDELVSRLDRHDEDETGEPDGYDGTTHRGDLSRLLTEEWLLAQELPDEFVRRVAEQELSYLRVARHTRSGRGRAMVIADTGPEQLGVGRLVQLAALVVLHRRASEAGTEMTLVLPGGATPHSPALLETSGGLGPALVRWLEARSSTPPTASDIASAFDVADAKDRVWLLAGPRTLRHAPAGHRRTVSGHATAWKESGVDRVVIRAGDSSVEVAVPDPAPAVATLRGEGLLRRRSDPTVTSVPTTGRGAVFHSADARLLWRGSTDQEIYGCFVGSGARARRYRFGGSVLAVNSLGKRVVAAVTDGEALWVEVIGKKLSRTHRIQVPLAALDLDRHALDELVTRPPAPLHLQGGHILVRLPSGWWELEDDHGWETNMRTVGPGHALDTPYAAFGTSGSAGWTNGHHVVDLAADPLLGPPAPESPQMSWAAWTTNSRAWTVARAGSVVDEIVVEERDRVVGLGVVDHVAFLLVTSESGRLVRQVSSRKVRTWTRLAGPAHFSLHPHRPWLARTTENRITVGDLRSGDVVLEIRAES